MSNNAAEIREVCHRLDPGNDLHWTSQGLPRMDALANLGLQVDRRELNEAYPGFGRHTLAKSAKAAAASSEAAAPSHEALDPERPYNAVESARACHALIVSRHERHRRALEVATKALDDAGLCLADLLTPTRCKLDRNMASRNRAARREPPRAS